MKDNNPFNHYSEKAFWLFVLSILVSVTSHGLIIWNYPKIINCENTEIRPTITVEDPEVVDNYIYGRG